MVTSSNRLLIWAGKRYRYIIPTERRKYVSQGNGGRGLHRGHNGKILPLELTGIGEPDDSQVYCSPHGKRIEVYA